MSLASGIGIQLLFAAMLVAVGGWLFAWRQWLTFRDRAASPLLPRIPPPPPPLPQQRQVLAGAGAAAQTPPGLAQTIQQLQKQAPSTRYRIPLGWRIRDGQALLNHGALVGDINHTLITAQSDGGKDNLAYSLMLSLALLHPPRDVQFGIVDGKGLDFARWEGKAHTWLLAQNPREIGPAMRALSEERERRTGILRAAGVSKWDSYTGRDLPLLVVYISELSLLQDAVGRTELESWLNSELAAGRAFGMRYILATQTASNFSTRWRSQIGLYLAGFQPRDDQDEPNTGFTTKQILASGSIPPSQLPPPPHGAGVFTLVYGRAFSNMRAPLITDTERAQWLAGLPDAPEVSEAAWYASGRSDAEEATAALFRSGQNGTLGKQGSREAVMVSESERAQIIAAAAIEPSRRKVCQRVFNTTGGRAWDKVRTVCDAERLLMSSESLEPFRAALVGQE